MRVLVPRQTLQLCALQRCKSRARVPPHDPVNHYHRYCCLSTTSRTRESGAPAPQATGRRRLWTEPTRPARLPAEADTIYALSTAPGRAAIAVVRVSGPACDVVYRALCPGKNLPKPRYAAFRALHDPADHAAVLDSGALVLRFPAPRTATGENVLELHVHGGPAVVKAVLGAVSRCSTGSMPIRYAEPGEFTRRAFVNDRIDLTQVEALGDILSAATEEQRRISVQGTTSGLTARYEEWRAALLHARGELEALIDFSEDQHFDESPVDLASSVAAQVRVLVGKIGLHSRNAVRGELLRNGIAISLIGSPNVGKSSLLNQLVGRNAAIVSKEAGTTRDIVEVGIDIGGFFCRLGDTAGLRSDGSLAHSDTMLGSAIGDVEKEGISRAKAKALQSDLILLVLSIEPSLHQQGHSLSLDPEVVKTAQGLLDLGKNVVVVVNKMDAYGGADPGLMADRIKASVRQVLPAVAPARIFCISCSQAATDSASRKSDAGAMQGFLDGLIHTFRNMTVALSPATDNHEPDSSVWQEALGATERQRVLLDRCAEHLQAFLDSVSASPMPGDSLGEGSNSSAIQSDQDDIDIVAATECLRAAADCLSQITGRGSASDVEEVLGVVFEK